MSTRKALTVRKTCCNKVFHVCAIPEAYSDKEFQKDCRKYAKEPEKYIIEEMENWEFGYCDCDKKKSAENITSSQLEMPL